MCVDNQLGIDIVLPVCMRDDKLSRRTVTAILIQVKNHKSFKCEVDKLLFDCMDPFRDGLFSEYDRPLPVIRMVFALGSENPGVVFPEDRRHNDAFTAYDIWCAGLSSDTFRDIGSDLRWYEALILRSMRRHDGFDVKETEEDIRNARERQRRRMVPLSAPDEANNFLHDPNNFEQHWRIKTARH